MSQSAVYLIGFLPNILHAVVAARQLWKTQLIPLKQWTKARKGCTKACTTPVIEDSYSLCNCSHTGDTAVTTDSRRASCLNHCNHITHLSLHNRWNCCISLLLCPVFKTTIFTHKSMLTTFSNDDMHVSHTKPHLLDLCLKEPICIPCYSRIPKYCHKVLPQRSTTITTRAGIRKVTHLPTE